VGEPGAFVVTLVRFRSRQDVCSATKLHDICPKTQ